MQVPDMPMAGQSHMERVGSMLLAKKLPAYHSCVMDGLVWARMTSAEEGQGPRRMARPPVTDHDLPPCGGDVGEADRGGCCGRPDNFGVGGSRLCRYPPLPCRASPPQGGRSNGGAGSVSFPKRSRYAIALMPMAAKTAAENRSAVNRVRPPFGRGSRGAMPRRRRRANSRPRRRRRAECPGRGRNR